MKITSTKMNKQGKRVCTVELDDGEFLQAFFLNGFYRMGCPVEDIVRGHHIVGARRVDWCAVNQDWVE